MKTKTKRLWNARWTDGGLNRLASVDFYARSHEAAMLEAEHIGRKLGLSHTQFELTEKPNTKGTQ
jgi:hypothetical protein